MTVTTASFRGAFPEFLDATLYPDAQLSFWLALAPKLHDVGRWGDCLDFGIQLFMAHNLSLEYNSNKAALVGGNPGAIIGVVTSGSVDKVSYGRDASAAMEPTGGHWNLSNYGLRWIRLSKMMGAGPVYVGANEIATVSASAWAGPYVN